LRYLAGLCALGAILLCSTAWGQAVSKAEEAAAISYVAASKAKAKQWRLCSQLYRQAATIDPATVEYLYSAALCESKAKRWQEAEKAWEIFLRRAPTSHALRAKASKRWQQAKEERKKAADAAQQAAKRAAEQKAAQKAAAAAAAKLAAERKAKADAAARARAAAGTTRLLAWGGVGAGVVAAAAGGWLTFDALDQADALEEQLNNKDSAGKVVGIDRDDALARQESANTRMAIGVSLMTVGAVMAGAGIWWLSGQPATSSAVVPTGRGLVWAVRF